MDADFSKRPSVLELLRERRAANSLPGKRIDPWSLALVIEGGGMRGIVSAGMVTALEQLGFTLCFDAAFGASAGSINAAYFLSRQATLGTTIYYEDINNKEFIDVRRLLFGSRPAMNLDLLFGPVMRAAKRLDSASVRSAGVPLVVAATSFLTGEPVYYDNFPTDDDLLCTLQAGATMPIVAGPPRSLNGTPVVDASLAVPIPYLSAIARGHTHLLVLLTRPPGRSRPTPTIVERVLFRRYINRHSGDARRLLPLFLNRVEIYNNCIDGLNRLMRGDKPGGVADVVTVSSLASEVSQTERSQERLVVGAKGGYDSVAKWLGYDSLASTTVLATVKQVTIPGVANHRLEVVVGGAGIDSHDH